jgi:TetR/AcrR family transcriptional regulator, lmrAB and yxaGH operons repressor
MSLPSRSAPTPAPATPDTSARILRAAQHLFRKRGYKGTGLNEILELAQAPKGSLYHHFPDGKEAIGVAVIETITAGIMGLFAASKARSAAALVRHVGAQLQEGIARTNHELCALFAGFVAERDTAPQLALAVAQAYTALADALAARLRADGVSSARAGDIAWCVVSLFEGASMVGMARGDMLAFEAAVRQAARLCEVEARAKRAK